MSHLCHQAIVVFPYLDNRLLKGPSYEEVSSTTRMALSVILDLGLQLNVENSTLTLLRIYKFTGVCLDSWTSMAVFPLDQVPDVIEPHQNNSRQAPDLSKKLTSTAGSHDCLHFHDGACEITPLLFPGVTQNGLHMKQTQCRQASIGSREGEALARLVDYSLQCRCRGPLPPTKADGDCDHRCIFVGLGGGTLAP